MSHNPDRSRVIEYFSLPNENRVNWKPCKAWCMLAFDLLALAAFYIAQVFAFSAVFFGALQILSRIGLADVTGMTPPVLAPGADMAMICLLHGLLAAVAFLSAGGWRSPATHIFDGVKPIIHRLRLATQATGLVAICWFGLCLVIFYYPIFHSDSLGGLFFLISYAGSFLPLFLVSRVSGIKGT